MSLFNKKTCLLAEQEYMYSCWTRRLVSLFNRKTCHLVQEEDMSSRHASLMNTKTCLLVEQEDMSSYWTTRQALLLNKKTYLLVKQTPNKHLGLPQEAPRGHPGGQRQFGSKIFVVICVCVLLFRKSDASETSA